MGINMIDVEVLEKLISNVLWTGWLEHEKPVSLLLIAKPESGKTEVLKKFNHNKGIVYATDVTAFGIVKGIFPLLDAKQPVNHIIIPDLLNPLSKQAATSRSFIQFMNSLVEEGIVKIHTYAIQVERNVQCGLVTAITRDAFLSHKKMWKRIGFLSRLLPFSYSYSVDSTRRIFESIIEEEYHHDSAINIDFPQEKKFVEGTPKLFEELRDYSIRLGEAGEVYGLRYQKHFQVLSKAHALMDGRNKVSVEDINWVKFIAEWINADFKQLERYDGKEVNVSVISIPKPSRIKIDKFMFKSEQLIRLINKYGLEHTTGLVSVELSKKGVILLPNAVKARLEVLV